MKTVDEVSQHWLKCGLQVYRLPSVQNLRPWLKNFLLVDQQVNPNILSTYVHAGAEPGFRRGGFVQEFRLANMSYPDVHDFSLRMQVIIAND